MAGRHSEFRSHEDSDEEIQIVGEERLKKYQKGTRNAFKTIQECVDATVSIVIIFKVVSV